MLWVRDISILLQRIYVIGDVDLAKTAATRPPALQGWLREFDHQVTCTRALCGHDEVGVWVSVDNAGTREYVVISNKPTAQCQREGAEDR